MILNELLKQYNSRIVIADKLRVSRQTVTQWETKNTWPLWALEQLGYTTISTKQLDHYKEMQQGLEKMLEDLA